MAWYKAGTVSVTNGSKNITFAGGANALLNVHVDDGFLGPDGKLYAIETVVSATSATLTTDYTGATATGQTYAIVPIAEYVELRRTLIAVNNLIDQYGAVVTGPGSGIFDPGSGTVPAIKGGTDVTGGTGLVFQPDGKLGLNYTLNPAGTSVRGLTIGADGLTANVSGACGLEVVNAVTSAGSYIGVTGKAGNGTAMRAAFGISGSVYNMQFLNTHQLNWTWGENVRMRLTGDGRLTIGDATITGIASHLIVSAPRPATALAKVGMTTFRTTKSDDTGWHSLSIGLVPDVDPGVSSAVVSYNSTGTNAGAHAFEVGNVERVRIGTDGALHVGKTVVGLSLVGVTARHTGVLHATASSDTPLHLNRLTTSGPIATFLYANSACGSITVNTGVTAYNTSSDYRLKTNVTPVEDAIDRVMALNPVRFNWIADIDGPMIDGFLAHEVQEIVPEAVTGVKDGTREEDVTEIDENGETVVVDTVTVPDHQGIDQAKLVPLLTAALQDAIRRIEALEALIPAESEAE